MVKSSKSRKVSLPHHSLYILILPGNKPGLHNLSQTQLGCLQNHSPQRLGKLMTIPMVA